jgi:hypothetical protein
MVTNGDKGKKMSTTYLSLDQTIDDRVLANQLRDLIHSESKPLAMHEIAKKLDSQWGHRAADILNEMTFQGTIASFRAGLSQYYAAPRVALTEQEPGLRTIISDSMNRVFRR